MGRARSDGYRVDSPGPTPSITNTTPVAPTHRPAVSSRTQGAGRTRDRRHRSRRPKDSGCRNPQVRKGIGSCVFVLGIPCLIAGLILTIVSSTNSGEKGENYPASFSVAGPVLLALSVICFIIGVLLYNIALWKHLTDCLQLSDKPDSFCRRHFPRLSAWLKPDVVAILNQAALKNLQTAPARSALRKMPNPDLVTVETELDEGEGHSNGDHHNHYHPPPRRKRAVTFSQGENLEGSCVGVRLDSSGSEQDHTSVQLENGGSLSDQSPSSSLLSLRHCRIHPKEDVFWTESSAGGSRVCADEGVGVGECGGGHPATSDSVVVGGDGGAGEGGGAAKAVKFPLTDIVEERA